jgi:hypothetical protein
LNFIYDPYVSSHYSWIWIVYILMSGVFIFYVISNVLNHLHYKKLSAWCHALVHLSGVLAIGTIFWGTTHCKK